MHDDKTSVGQEVVTASVSKSFAINAARQTPFHSNLPVEDLSCAANASTRAEHNSYEYESGGTFHLPVP
jgi:hypothetical protein